MLTNFYRFRRDRWECSESGLKVWRTSDILAGANYEDGARQIGRCPWAEVVRELEVDRLDWQRDDSVLITVIRASNEEVQVRRSPKGVLTIMLLPSDEPLAEPEITAIERAAENAYQNYDGAPNE